MKTPTIPVDLDDALYDALCGIVGDELAVGVVEIVWEVICEHGGMRSRPLTDRLRRDRMNNLIGFDIGGLK